ncbi:NAD(P)H-dependent oxidoreductase [Candidatus Woesearchaeota archaeon]|nr:NAD(P)H-dependent oxidoreductase [Candidatus Woesearchaeota archaeon]
MELKQIVLERYATKKFDGKTIEQKKVDELLDIIRLAPSSWNLQPWKIKIVTDSKLKEKLRAASWNQEQITTCSHLFIFCANKDIDAQITALKKLMLSTKVPEQTVKEYEDVVRGSFKNLSEEKKIAWAQRQVYIALENALLGAKASGFDSCPMEGFDAEAYAKILNLPENLVPTVVCPIGFAADKPKQKTRFAAKDVFF